MTECAREREMLDVVAAGRWPHSCDDELRSHVPQCEICLDLVEVMTALSGDRATTSPLPRIPSAGLMWWRAQMRMRRHATGSARRRIVALHSIAVALAAIAAIAVLAPMIAASPLPAGLSASVREGIALETLTGPLALSFLGIIALFALAPLAAWIAISDR
ncbi:MAG TPA: hypothetical protein VMT00_12370 [Thermoanaerobaculia bacterium]|nr:hypothetical protein [Thermoanaerobaculia bacterium]